MQRAYIGMGANIDSPTGAPEATLAAARNTDERCEAQYYIGEWQLLRDARVEAVTALRFAAETCKKNFIEYYGAIAELKRLGE